MAKQRQRAIRGTGSVFEDSKRPGSYIGKVTIDGRTHKVRGSSAIDARDKLNRVIANPPEPKASKPTAVAHRGPVEGLTVSELFDEWQRRDLDGRDVSPATLTYHRWSARLWSDTLGHIAVADLTVADVEEALDIIMTTARRSRDDKYRSGTDTPLGRATLSKVLSTLKQALEFGVRRGYVPVNVARSALMPAEAAKSTPRQSLTPDEARKLLAELRTIPNGLRFGVSLLLGLRPGEAAALYWSDVDLDAGTLTVNRGLQLDQRSAPHIVDTLKTTKAHRTIEMDADLVDWCKEHRAAAGVVPIDGRGLMFPNAQGEAIHPKTSRTELADICKRLGIREAKPNELRHSCASLLIDQGKPIERVADLLGHTDTRMVDTTYRHRVRPTVGGGLSLDLGTEAK